MAEITGPVALCRSSGRLNPEAVGWSRRPLQHCNLTGRWPRKKRWNYWAFTSNTHLFSMTVSNIDYLGLAFVYLADFEKGTVVEETVVTPLGSGCVLPEHVDENVTYESKRMQMSMVHRHDVGHTVDFRANMARFGGETMEANLQATYPEGHETLNVVIPWDDKRFQFTAKHNTLPLTGTVAVGSREITFDGPEVYATLDFGRGVWPARCEWNWGAANGVHHGRTIGLNLGGKWTDGTGQTENAVCIDGILRKNDEDLVWDYDPSDWMKPWRVTSPGSDAIAVEFTPKLERVAVTDAVILKSEVHQLFGHYSGTVREAGEGLVSFDGLVGWAEEHRAVW